MGLGFSVFRFFGFGHFEIGFLVFAIKIFRFGIQVAVFGFSHFDNQFSVFVNKKVVFQFLLFACLAPRPHYFGSFCSVVFRWKFWPVF